MASSNDPVGILTRSFWAVIPAGGAGTRLWPLSRKVRPKFLLPLLDQRSLLQVTADRLHGLATPEHTLVVCGGAHAVAVARQLPALPDENILVEPSPLGSGPAIGLAAAIIARQDPEAVMGSFAADHDVRDPAAFLAAVRVAIAAAEQGWLVTIGLTPSRPETGYGYIERTDEPVLLAGESGAFRAAGFVEKPDRERAAAYLASGRFLWNASMFVWRAASFLAELARLQPELHAGVTRIATAWGTEAQDRVLAEVWPTLPPSTVDVGVMERTGRIAVVPAEMGWSDVGDWHGLGALLDPDEHGNAMHGPIIQMDTTDSVVWSDAGRLVALLGMANAVVVDTPDALLVADRSRAQEVRALVDRLTSSGRGDLT